MDGVVNGDWPGYEGCNGLRGAQQAQLRQVTGCSWIRRCGYVQNSLLVLLMSNQCGKIFLPLVHRKLQ